MSKMMRACPECREHAAVHLGDLDGAAMYACVECDAEFHVPLPES